MRASKGSGLKKTRGFAMGYLKFTNPIDETAARERIQARIEELNEVSKVWVLVLPVLKKWDGKKLNKRLFGQIAEAIGGNEGYNPTTPGTWAVRGGVEYSWYALKLRSDRRSPMDEIYEYSFTLHYLSSYTFNYNEFTGKDGACFMPESVNAEIARCERALQELPGAVTRWNNALKELQGVNNMMDNTPVAYSPFFDINGK